ncbi:MAG: hypothetical protein ABI876_18965 [Bacteroidota bacterium]
MNGVSIVDLHFVDGFPTIDSIDLRAILDVLRDEVLSSQWTINDCEAAGIRAGALNGLSDSGRVISGEELLYITAGIYQTISGNFNAFRLCSHLLWFKINAIDSVAFDILSDDRTILDKIRSHFTDVSDWP